MRLSLPLLLCLFSPLSLEAAPREWTDLDGRKIQADYVSATATSVTIRKPGTGLVEIPLARLSEADRRWIAEGAGSPPPAPPATKTTAKSGSTPSQNAGPLTYRLSDGADAWPEDRRRRITDAMDAAVAFLNQHGSFSKAVIAHNSPGTPTADANWSGWINWGGSINRRVALHEIAHTLGVGTHPNWRANIKDGKWTGRHALRQLREFDGPDATLYADRMHFWPYGLNFDQESSPESDLRFVKMVAALRLDMGIE